MEGIEFQKLSDQTPLARLIEWRRIAVDYRDGRFNAEWKENLEYY